MTKLVELGRIHLKNTTVKLTIFKYDSNLFFKIFFGDLTAKYPKLTKKILRILTNITAVLLDAQRREEVNSRSLKNTSSSLVPDLINHRFYRNYFKLQYFKFFHNQELLRTCHNPRLQGWGGDEFVLILFKDDTHWQLFLFTAGRGKLYLKRMKIISMKQIYLRTLYSNQIWIK